MGVEIQDITSDRVSALKLKEERGVEVTMVDQDAPAGKAGVKEHDVILEYNGVKIESEEQIRRMIRETPPGRTVALGISRDGSHMTVNVQLGDRAQVAADNIHKLNHDRFAVVIPGETIELPDFNLPAFDFQVGSYAPVLGVQVETIGHQLADFFGVKNGEGLLVKSVEKGSSAEKAGIKAGDVITRVGNENITDRSDLRRVLRAHSKDGKVEVGIVRDKHEQTVTVEVANPKTKQSSSWKDYYQNSQETMEHMRAQWEKAAEASKAEWEKQAAKWQGYGKEWERYGKEMERSMSRWKANFSSQWI